MYQYVIPFLWLNGVALYKYNKFYLSIHHSWVVSTVCVTVVNNATMNIHIRVFVWTSVFNAFGCLPRNRIVKSGGNFVFNIWGAAKLFSPVATLFYISAKNVWRYQFLALSALIRCKWSPLGVVVMYGIEASVYLILLNETADFITVSPVV